MNTTPLNNPFEFKDDKERLQSAQERSKVGTWLKSHVQEMIDFHRDIRRGQNPYYITTTQLVLLDTILNATICGVYHDAAEQTFLGLDREHQ